MRKLPITLAAEERLFGMLIVLNQYPITYRNQIVVYTRSENALYQVVDMAYPVVRWSIKKIHRI